MDWEINGTKGFADLTYSSSNNWTLNKDYLQEVKVGVLGGFFGEGNKKSIYKLVLNSVFEKETKVNFENQEIKGALGLIQATWKGKTGGESGWEVKQEVINDENKVWLIMAQGKESIYLMPSIRTSGECGWYDSEWENKKAEEAKKEINEKGIESITVWIRRYDRRSEMRKKGNTKFHGITKGGKGFSITRVADMAIQRRNWWGGEISPELKENAGKIKELWDSLGPNLSKDYVRMKWIEFLYKNAGILDFTEKSEGTQKCNEVEHYFPLDLVIFGKSEETKNPKVTYENNGQKITINDTISEVIGVRLD